MSAQGPAGAGILGTTLVAVFLVSFDATVATAAFPALRADFAHVSPTALSWILNAYTLVYAALLVPSGGLADATGRERAFRRGLLLFTLASVACGLAPSAELLIAARAAQAAGAALLTPAALGLALASVPAEKRTRVVGLWSAVGAFAAAVGPAAGSVLIDALSWRAVFWVNLPCGLLLLWRLGRTAQGREPGEHDEISRGAPRFGALDFRDAALVALGAGLLVWSMAEAPHAPPVLTALRTGSGIAILGIFVAGTLRRHDAAIDLRLFRNPVFRWANLATLLFGACFGAMFVSFYLFMTGVWGYGQSRAGLAATAGPAVVIAVATCGGRIIERLGSRRTWTLGGLLFGAGQAWYGLRVETAPDYLGTWLPGQVLSGAGIGLLMPALAGAAASRLARERLAAGNAINQALRQLGLAFGVAAAVAATAGAEASLENFRALYAALAAGGLVIAAFAWIPKERAFETAPA